MCVLRFLPPQRILPFARIYHIALWLLKKFKINAFNAPDTMRCFCLFERFVWNAKVSSRRIKLRFSFSTPQSQSLFIFLQICSTPGTPRKLLTQLWSYISGERATGIKKVRPLLVKSRAKLICFGATDKKCFWLTFLFVVFPGSTLSAFERGARYQRRSIIHGSVLQIGDGRCWQFDCAAVCEPLICDLLAQNHHQTYIGNMFYVFFSSVSTSVIACVWAIINVSSL